MNNLEKIKEEYPIGTIIEVINMQDDYNPIEKGTQGEIVKVDDAGTLHMKWDNGRTLGIVVGVDSFKVISKPCEQKLNNCMKMM